MRHSNVRVTDHSYVDGSDFATKNNDLSMKQPNLHIHFSSKQPEEPGLWLARNNRGYISVVDVQKSDIEQSRREPSFLAGEWAARLTLADRLVLQLDQTRVLEWLDNAIVIEADARNSKGVAALQKFRLAFFGEELKHASVAQLAEQDSLKVLVAGSTPAGRANPEPEPEPSGMDAVVRQHGFRDLQEFNHLVSSADLTTPERFDAFMKWKLNDGTKDGLLKLPSR